MNKVAVFTDFKKVFLLVLLNAFSLLKCYGQYSFPAQGSTVYPNIQYYYSVPPTCFNYYWSCSNPSILWNLDPYNVTPNCYITWVNPNPYPITAYLYLTAVDYIGGGSGGSGGSSSSSGSSSGGSSSNGGSSGSAGAGSPAGTPSGPSAGGGSSGGSGGSINPSGGGPAGAPGGGSGGEEGGGGESGSDSGGGGGGDERTTSTTTPTGDCSSYTWAVTILPNPTGCPSPVNLYACGSYSYGAFNMGATNTVYAGGPSSVCTPGVSGAFAVDLGGNVNMKAGVNILLQPGFTVNAGGTFKASIGQPCTDGVDFRQSAPSASSAIATTVPEANVVNVYPNPTSEFITISFNYAKKTSGVTIKVIDLLGKEIYEQEVGNAQIGEAKVNLNGQPAGIYIVQVTAGNSITNQKVVLAK